MIFLTTGTQLPFDRLVRALDDWVEVANPSCEIFGQVLPDRHDPYVPKSFRPVERLSPTEYAEVFDRARLIVSHAGMGTILTALTQGKQICVMPRQVKYKEHRNDHQLATIEKLRAHPGLFRARDEHQLPGCLDAAMKATGTTRTTTIDRFAPEEFTGSLRKFILAAQE